MDQIDSLFGAFDQQEERPNEAAKSKKKKNKKNKRKPDQDLLEQAEEKPESKKQKEVIEQGEEEEPATIEQKLGHRVFKEEDYVSHRNETENCIHEYIAPSTFERKPYQKPEIPAKEYAFTLDRFQAKAVECIERNESVLVAAHTSAGKTAIAEYAIAKSLKNQQRVIYTSPIKALSNQKYRELDAEFKDVGLMTGDVTINENASCIVMTTEILRSMLYNGSTITREMAWVIFDEVHYMRDKERGVVWEETIILLSQNVKMVFLSATIPNAREFVEWIVKTKQEPCNVVYTDYRPTPLQHYIFPSGGEGLFMVVDEKGNFRDENFSKALSHMEDSQDLDKIMQNKAKKKEKQMQGAEMKKLITLIVSRGLDPCIVFSFSKRDCETHVMSLKNCTFNNEDEQEQVEKIYNNAIGTLSEEDQQLPQITSMLPLLKRGLGMHHGGLLPIVKEVIELLFQDGKLKVLFTTETFSMGINMPAKTVVFTSIEKFDGDEYRWISGGEYIQMSGRAGRRGLDKRGIVILMANKKLEPDVAKGMLKGKSDALYSSFHLGYNMLLNMMRVQDIVPENIILNSFHQFQSERALPTLQEKLAGLKEKSQQIACYKEREIQQFDQLDAQKSEVRSEMRKIVMLSENVGPFLLPGRLLRVKSQKTDWGWGVLLNFQKTRINIKDRKKPIGFSKTYSEEGAFILDIGLFVKNKVSAVNELQPVDYLNEEHRFGVIPVLLSPDIIHDISTCTLNLPHDVKKPESQKTLELMLKEFLRRFKGKIPLMDPVADMEIEDEDLQALSNKEKQIQEKMDELPEISELERDDYERKKEIKAQTDELERAIDESSEMILKENLKQMKRVMRRLDLCDKNDVPQLRGKVAAQVSAADEILASELLVSNVLTALGPNEIVSLCSCLVFTDTKGDGKMCKEPHLVKPFEKFQEMASKVAQVMIESKVQIDKEEYVKSFKPDMIDVTLHWCRGASFKEICDEAEDIYEGTIIRAFRRLAELMEQLVAGCATIGDAELKGKIEEGIKSLKRGVPFSASLYL